MIDAKAVWAQLQRFAKLSLEEQRGSGLQEYVQQFCLTQERDEAGNVILTVPGKRERAVVLGSRLTTRTAGSHHEARLDLVAGLETMKALAHRFDGVPPCTVILYIWGTEERSSSSAETAASSLLARKAAAYLGMHLDELRTGEPSLGVVTGASSDEPSAFNPRLAALCDEAVRELTGRSVPLPEASYDFAAAVARSGIPTALMYVKVPAFEEENSEASRVTVLQAAEAFGRWAEATMHLVAGEDVDLWAREKRVPHSH